MPATSPSPPLLPPGIPAATLRSRGWAPAWSLDAARLGAHWRDSAAIAAANPAKAWIPPAIVADIARIAPPPDLARPSEPHWPEPDLDRVIAVEAIRRAVRFLPDIVLWSRIPPAEVQRALRAAARLDARRPDAPLAPSPGRWRGHRVAVFADQPEAVRIAIRAAVDAGLLPLLPRWREQLAA